MALTIIKSASSSSGSAKADVEKVAVESGAKIKIAIAKYTCIPVSILCCGMIVAVYIDKTMADKYMIAVSSLVSAAFGLWGGLALGKKSE
ncbi:MAG: hypothetical protein ORN51_04475 [Akkermansiaceae bacterium]|nr:hypothetical protein [Akkermansiaceae bacterium]